MLPTLDLVGGVHVETCVHHFGSTLLVPLPFHIVDILIEFMNVTKNIAVTSPTLRVYGLVYASYVHGPDLQFPHSSPISITIKVKKCL